MTFAELKNRVAVVNLGRSDDETLDKAGEAINWVLCEYLPIKGLKPFLKTTDLTTTAEQEYIDLPEDFAGLKIAQVLQDDGSYNTMSDMMWEDTENSDTGEPSYKMILPSPAGWRLYLRPVPDEVYTIRIWYYAKQTELTNDDDEPVLSIIYGDGPVISGATWRLAVELEIESAVPKWEQIFHLVDLPSLLQWQESFSLQGYKKYSWLDNPYK
jgi:hypothetical protein